MTALWLLIWLVSSVPPVHAWNAWLVSLLICAGIDIVFTRERAK